MPQATALGAKMCRGIFFIAENVCEKAWRRLARAVSYTHLTLPTT